MKIWQNWPYIGIFLGQDLGRHIQFSNLTEIFIQTVPMPKMKAIEGLVQKIEPLQHPKRTHARTDARTLPKLLPYPLKRAVIII